MATTFDVRIWALRENKRAPRNGKPANTYSVRWTTDNTRPPHIETFATKTLADGYRSKLLTAARRGEAFDVETGKPASELTVNDISWYDFACQYVDAKWSRLSANSRKSQADALMTVTIALIKPGRSPKDAKALRAALRSYAFNTKRRKSAQEVRDVRDLLDWVAVNVLPVAALQNPDPLRAVLDSVESKLDGTPCAATMARRRRAVLHNAMEYAVDRKHLPVNPVSGGARTTPRVSHAIDRRSVVSPWQARTLLKTLADERPSGARDLSTWQSSGPRLVAFFALMYFAALRPEEAVNVRQANLVLPSSGWGDIYLEEATPEAGAEWTNDGRHQEVRPLKHRGAGEIRPVPCTPELVAHLRRHIELFGTGPGGRLFVGLRGGGLTRATYGRVWDRTREHTFTPEVYASALGKTPYSLRHACVSTWLNGGVAPAQVAEWAGHSIEVLLKVYAKCIDGQDVEARRRALAALGAGPAGS